MRGRDHATDLRLSERSREVLEESVAQLDGRTLSRLTQARYAALARTQRPGRVWWRSFAPAGAVAAVAVLALVIYAGRPDLTTSLPEASAEAAVEVDLFADADALELAEEGDELDFYEWAALEADDADALRGS